jgi:hypothetical protein
MMGEYVLLAQDDGIDIGILRAMEMIPGIAPGKY